MFGLNWLQVLANLETDGTVFTAKFNQCLSYVPTLSLKPFNLEMTLSINW